MVCLRCKNGKEEELEDVEICEERCECANVHLFRRKLVWPYASRDRTFPQRLWRILVEDSRQSRTQIPAHRLSLLPCLPNRPHRVHALQIGLLLSLRQPHATILLLSAHLSSRQTTLAPQSTISPLLPSTRPNTVRKGRSTLFGGYWEYVEMRSRRGTTQTT